MVVVAGGVGEFDENVKSVELLQEGELEWTLGQDLPTPIRDSSMITDQDGGAVIIGGISPDAYFVGQVKITFKLLVSRMKQFFTSTFIEKNEIKILTKENNLLKKYQHFSLKLVTNNNLLFVEYFLQIFFFNIFKCKTYLII